MAIGKNVGKLSIRVLPDATEFRRELRALLNQAEREAKITVEVDADTTQARDEIRRLASDEDGEKVTLNVNAATAAASAQLKYVSRDRFATIIPTLQKAGLTKVTTQLAALSGARIAFDAVDDVLSFIGRLDRVLPKASLITTGLTSVVNLLGSTVSGLVGIGGGLAAIGPAFLVLPGLILGTAVAITAFAVAMKDAKEQLAPLGADMRELGEIISSRFWAQARDPIIDLIKNLMPQLRTAFGEVSESVGGFFGALATSFDAALAGGKLEALFAGISESFDILATGTDQFAGAIVSLSAVAAQYSPRLASWFVKVADQFDTWLKETAEDGRLTGWIDAAIEAMKDAGRAVNGFGRQLRALEKATRDAGGKGLKGFADTMQDIAKTMESGRFQRTMRQIFEGFNDGTAAIGAGFDALGNTMADRTDTIKFFLSQSGVAVGQLVTDIAEALNRPIISSGIETLIAGFRDGLASFGTYLPTISDGVGGLLKLAGDLATNLGPVLGQTLSTLSTAFQPALDALGDLTDALGPTLVTAIENLEDPLSKVGEALAPLIVTIGDLAVEIAPEVTEAVTGLLDFLSGFTIPFYDFTFTALLHPEVLWDDEALNKYITEPGMAGKFGEFFDTILTEGHNFDKDWDKFWSEDNQAFEDWATELESFRTDFAEGWDDFWSDLGKGIEDGVDSIEGSLGGGSGGVFGSLGMVDLTSTLAPAGISLMTGLYNGITTTFPQTKGFIDGIPAQIKAFKEDPAGWLATAGASVMGGLYSGITTAFPQTKGFIDGIPAQLAAFQQDPAGWLLSAGTSAMGGLYSGITTAFPQTKGFLDSLPGRIAAFQADPAGWLRQTGVQVISGMAQGLRNAFPQLAAPITAIETSVKSFLANPGQWLYESGKSIIQGLARGIRDAAETAKKAALDALASVRNLFPNSPAKEGPFSGRGWTTFSGRAIGEGLASGIDSSVDGVRSSALAMMNAASAAGQTVDLASASTTLANRQDGDTGNKFYIDRPGASAEEIAAAIERKKRQAATLAGLRKVAIA